MKDEDGAIPLHDACAGGNVFYQLKFRGKNIRILLTFLIF